MGFFRLLNRFPARPGIIALLALGLALFATGCGIDLPQNTFAADGDVARDQRFIFELALWPAVVILILVMGALVYALFRFRYKKGDPAPHQTHGNTRLEVAWTIAPAILLFGLGIPMVIMIFDIGRAPAEDALNIRVTGFQFNWQFEYIDPEFQDEDGNPLTIIGQCPTQCAHLHIPVDREIGIFLEAADVIHSFWVPRLAGKLDAIPGRTNRMWLNARETGSFSGQCAEFCGVGHADMRFVVVAQTEEEFQQWADEMLADGEAAASGGGGSRVVAHGE